MLQVKGPITFITTIGLPKTGKSTITNLILNGDDENYK